MNWIKGYPTFYAGIVINGLGAGMYHNDMGVGLIATGVGLIVLGLMQVCK